MCGIFAAISLIEPFDKKDELIFNELTDIVSYRGPDSSGYKTYSKEEYNENQFQLFLGHRRLAIIDLSAAGHQPMEVDSVRIVFNGEIFNYIEIRNELIEKGISFHTDTDTEVIIRVYQTYGEEGFHKFNGMWAFVLYDEKKQRVIASRDRFSIKPLYYLFQHNRYYFSSEIKQLTPLLENKVLFANNMYKFINQAILDDDVNTFFEGIKKVPARHNLIIDLNNRKDELKSYWSFNYIKPDASLDVIEEFKSLFIDSLKLRLRSDVKIGSLLSGGLDSSAITAIAAIQAGNSFESFSVVSDDKSVSEEKFVRILTEENRIKNTKLHVHSSEMMQDLNTVLYHQDEPFAGFSIIAQNQIFKKIKQETDITVVLSGQGGDEILMGYLKYYFFYLKNLKSNGNYIRIAREILTSLIQRTVMWQLDLKQAARYRPSQASALRKYQNYSYQAVSTWDASNLRNRQIEDIERFSVPALAHYEDRNSMAWSIESRLPFLDHRLVDFMLNVDTSVKIKDGWNKYILRKSITEMPDKIRWRRDKKGFTVPEKAWIQGELRTEFMKEFKTSKLAEMGIIQTSELIQAYNKFIEGKSTIPYAEFIRLFIAEKWAKMHFS